jgi:hypothetical protein
MQLFLSSLSFSRASKAKIKTREVKYLTSESSAQLQSSAGKTVLLTSVHYLSQSCIRELQLINSEDSERQQGSL